ncbi:hypothetical protein KAT08_02875 [Candidatus Babeliales bacterium]|nr:hypothetical protein [Candidatus Babeliales bacterium]
MFYKIFETIKNYINKQNKLFSILLALKNEYKYNSKHRGNEQSRFKITSLTKAIENPLFYTLYKSIAEECLKINELANDANQGQLFRRKMVPADVQEMMTEVADKINEILPELEKSTTLLGYIHFLIKKLFSSKYKNKYNN